MVDINPRFFFLTYNPTCYLKLPSGTKFPRLVTYWIPKSLKCHPKMKDTPAGKCVKTSSIFRFLKIPKFSGSSKNLADLMKRKLMLNYDSSLHVSSQKWIHMDSSSPKTLAKRHQKCTYFNRITQIVLGYQKF